MALGKPNPNERMLQDGAELISRPQEPTSTEQRPFQYPMPNADASMAAFGIPVYYGALNLSIAKSYTIHPTNQGQRGGIASRQAMMFDPRNSPSRSQFNEGYTVPIQQYGATLLWDTPSGQHTAGKRQVQPSTKLASPFSTNVPIKTRMPWDL
jgi:hypothetical protein